MGLGELRYAGLYRSGHATVGAIADLVVSAVPFLRVGVHDRVRDTWVLSEPRVVVSNQRQQSRATRPGGLAPSTGRTLYGLGQSVMRGRQLPAPRILPGL